MVRRLVLAPLRRRTALAAALLVGLGLSVWPVQHAPATSPGTSVNFDLVGHNPLYGRGMNAAPALYNDPESGKTWLYVGSRTDGSSGHPHSGILVLDATDPSAPQVVGEIGPPRAGNVSETSRELRVWPEKKLLLVLNFSCSSAIHACAPGSELTGPDAAIRFFDLSNPASPELVLTYFPSAEPHEVFLWDDPFHAGRALLFMSTPSSGTTAPNLIVADISPVGEAPSTQPVEVATWSANDDYGSTDRQTDDVRLHSMGVSPDGTRTYLAYLGGGFLVLDSSALLDPATAPPIALTLKTPVANRARWGNPGVHSAVKVLGTNYALTTDEVYGDLVTPLQAGKGRHGCPWGWLRVLDVSDETQPQVVSEYKIPENDASYCTSPDGHPANTAATSYASHNPTVLPDVAFVTWHSDGLQAIDLANPLSPTQAGVFVPTPLASVSTEDPALSLGLNKAVMWSFPIFNRQGGQTYLYVVDVRNGLYVLRYTGPRAATVNALSFLEGNSNLGDAPALDGVTVPPPAGGGGITFGPLAPATLHMDSPAPVGEVDRAGEFGGVADGPVLVRAAPAGPVKVQETSRFGNPGFPANVLLAYFELDEPVRIQGTPTVDVWVSAPSAPGISTVALSVELFVDGSPKLGQPSGTAWDPISFPVDVGPVPTKVTLTLPTVDLTALDSLVLQLHVEAPTVGPQPKNAVIWYGSPDLDSTLSAPMAFAV